MFFSLKKNYLHGTQYITSLNRKKINCPYQLENEYSKETILLEMKNVFSVCTLHLYSNVKVQPLNHCLLYIFRKHMNIFFLLSDSRRITIAYSSVCWEHLDQPNPNKNGKRFHKKFQEMFHLFKKKLLLTLALLINAVPQHIDICSTQYHLSSLFCNLFPSIGK